MSNANDPARWTAHQWRWDVQRPPLEFTRRVGWLLLHAEPVTEDGDRQIHATTAEGGVYVGEMFYGEHPTFPGRLEGAPEVHPKYRRRGICTALYDLAEELGGAEMFPADTHSADAAAFWRARRAARAAAGG